MSDLIDRQAAINALFELYEYQRVIDPTEAADLVRQGIFLAEKKIEKLPSAQPIIRCKDCRHRDPEDKKCDCGHDILWQLPREDRWYCADAERRTDETD